MSQDNWFADAFTNFDVDKEGFLKFDCVVDILEQHVDILRKKGIAVASKDKSVVSAPAGGGAKTATLEGKLLRAAKDIFASLDPGNSGMLDQDKSVSAIKKLWKAVPDLGRCPSSRWCKDAFTNFDLKKAGEIPIESWCEIVRQYCWKKLNQWPENFKHGRIVDGGRGGGGGDGGDYRAPGGALEAVAIGQHVITPTYSGKMKLFDDYEMGKKLGEGAFGKVHVATHKRTGITRVCKSIVLKGKDQQKLVDTEISLLKQLDHPNIMRLFEAYYDGDTTIYLITEICNGGSLFDRLIYHTRSLKRPMSERQSGRYTQQILQALSYCHAMKIVHRDIKPDNVLFVNRKSDSSVKVIDFGLSDFLDKIEAAAKTVRINKDKEKIAEGIRRSLGVAIPGATDPLLRKVMPKAGTPHYMPPEMHHKAWYDEKADTFAVGVMLYQMLTGIHPFFIPGRDNAETAKQKIVLCRVDYPADIWNNVSPLAKQMTQQLLEEDPKKRLGSVEALRHKWFNSSKKVETDLRPSVVDSLLRFQQHNKLKQAVLRLLAKEVDEDTIAVLKEQFSALDQDGSGIVTFEEVVKVAENCGIRVNRTELEQCIFALHAPGVSEGKLELGLNYRDFIAALIEKKIAVERGHLQEIFRRFEDPACPGYMTAKSLKEALKTNKRTAAASGGDIAQTEMSGIDAFMPKDAKINFQAFLDLTYSGELRN
ncbi:unnamed protein product [Amoebophrya sp. A25]|nr:unnamed protein product [Amoebophrya sp. A25]|eukprot:GSA25T00024425001.1